MIQKRRLIIFTHFAGRFANQLFIYAHLMAFLLEHPDDFDFINLSFSPYAYLLENTSEKPICIFPTHHTRWQSFRGLNYLLHLKLTKGSTRIKNNTIRMLYAFANLSGVQSFLVGSDPLSNVVGQKKDSLDLANPNDIGLFYQANTTFLAGWGIKSWELVENHQDKIREGMMFASIYTKIAQEFIQGLRNKYDVLIGVLIRQGDYRTWANGRYYFETEQYINWIKQAKEVFGVSRKVGFVVASDEEQDFYKFQDLNVYFATGSAVGKGHYIENMAELSLCDLVMTAPSTFSAWSAFLGDIPILPLVEPSQVISENDLLAHHIFDAIKHPHLSVSVQ